MRLKMLVVVGVCLLLAAPAAQGADKEKDSYAKVELKGTFDLGTVPRRLPFVTVDSDVYCLDFSQVPGGVDRDKLKKLDGKTVIVKGKLKIVNGPPDLIFVVVTSIHDPNVM